MPELPLFPTALVGSFPQPEWLIDRARLAGRFPPRVRARELWRPAPEYLARAQDDATRLAILEQERAGLDVVGDGEIRRESYSNHFATALLGLDLDNPGEALDRSGHPNPVPRVSGPVSRPHPVEVSDVRFLRQHTGGVIKMTVPGPFTMSQQAQDDFYGDPEALADAYADAVNAEIKDLFAAGADIVQVDEPYLQARPEPARRYGIRALNRALAGVEGTTAVHLCFGYAAIIHERPSGYSFLPELADCTCDLISIETAQSNLDTSVLAHFTDKRIMLGVVDLSTPEVETAETVAARVRRALPYVAPERVVIATDCGMKYLPWESAVGKMRAMAGAAQILRAEFGTGEGGAGVRRTGVTARTIPELLVAAAARDPDGVWVRTDEGTATFAGAAGQVARLAQRLRDAGIGRGDLVVVTARTTPPYLFCWLALAAIGAVTVPTDPAAAAPELAGLIGQVQPRAVITDAALSPSVTGPAVFDISSLVDDWRAGLADELGSDSAPEDLAVLIPTSGTTGRSKLVMQTQLAYAMAGEGFPYWMELAPTDRLMTSLPLFHINAPAYSVLGSLACGAGLVLLPRFSASGFLDSARRHGATEFNAIGAMLEMLMRQPERDDDARSPLRLCYTGPSPARDWQERFEQRFDLRVVCGYAMSESPYGLIWRHGARPFGTLGSPRQHPSLGTINRARVVDADGGHECQPGETGELLLQNPTITPGYWGMPEETAAAIVDGWLHTGDLVTVNRDGTYTFVARRKEVLRRRGLNLSPAEVEEAIAAHPDVLDVAVIGVASELTEEEVKAFVVARPGASLDFAELRAFAGERLSAFKVPRYWQAIDALPRTPTSRVAKHRLPGGHPAGEYDADNEPRPAG